MARTRVCFFDFVVETNDLLRGDGLFLVAVGKDGKANAMTIGWGLVGTMWRQPFFAVAVRLSRYTRKLLDESGEFTVCLPAEGMENELDICGTKSGREMDKFKDLNLKAVKGFEVKAPYILQCPVHYECKVAYRTEVKPGQLDEALEQEVYPKGDYHVIYYGLIKGTYAENDARKMLPK